MRGKAGWGEKVPVAQKTKKVSDWGKKITEKVIAKCRDKEGKLPSNN